MNLIYCLSSGILGAKRSIVETTEKLVKQYLDQSWKQYLYFSYVAPYELYNFID